MFDRGGVGAIVVGWDGMGEARGEEGGRAEERGIFHFIYYFQYATCRPPTRLAEFSF